MAMSDCSNPNQSISLSCLREFCSGSTGGDVTAGVIATMFLTALTVAGVSLAVHIAMHVWFYKPRMNGHQLHGQNFKVGEDDPYEDMTHANPDKPADAENVQLKKNKAYAKFVGKLKLSKHHSKD